MMCALDDDFILRFYVFFGLQSIILQSTSHTYATYIHLLDIFYATPLYLYYDSSDLLQYPYSSYSASPL